MRPLEIGSLLENEEIKTEAGLLSIAEMFAGSEGSVISLDELLPKSFGFKGKSRFSSS